MIPSANPLTTVVGVDDEYADLAPVVRAASAVGCDSRTLVMRWIPVPVDGHCAKCEFRVSSDTLLDGFMKCRDEHGLAQHHFLVSMKVGISEEK